MTLTKEQQEKGKLIEKRRQEADALDQKIGEAIAKELRLEPSHWTGEKFDPVRFDLTNGSKTHIGLARTIKEIIDKRGEW